MSAWSQPGGNRDRGAAKCYQIEKRESKLWDASPLSLSPPATFTPSPPHALQALRPARVWEPPSLGFLSSGHGWGGRGDLRPPHSALSCSRPSSSWLHRPAKLSISPLRPHLPRMSFNSPFRAPKKEEPTCEKTLLCPKDCVRHLCVTSLKSSSGKVHWGPREGKGGGEGAMAHLVSRL